MSKTQKADKRLPRGRPGILPPLGVDFKTALGALLRTPPPPKGEATDKPKAARKRKGARKRGR